MDMTWEKLKKYANEVWREFLKLLRDETDRMMFGIVVALFGVALSNGILSGFGLGVAFASALALYWRKKGVKQTR